MEEDRIGLIALSLSAVLHNEGAKGNTVLLRGPW